MKKNVTSAKLKAVAASKLNLMPSNSLVLHRVVGSEQIRCGTLDFNGDTVKFDGDAEESAKSFIEFVSLYFKKRLAEEFERGREQGLAESVSGALAGQMPGKVLIAGETIGAVAGWLDNPDGGFNDGVLWLGKCRDEDGVTVYGLHIANFECPEEGSITLTDLPEPTK